MTSFLRSGIAVALTCVLSTAGCDNAEPMTDAGPEPTDAGGGDAGTGETTFTVRVENVSGGGFPTPIAPGVWVAHDAADPLFAAGEVDRGEGLEALAEDGDPATLAGTLSSGGAFTTPVGGSAPAPAFPGEAYEFEVTATPEAGNLSLATMLVRSNDLFFAPSGAGIPLFDASGAPLAERDVTEMVNVYQAGTEADQAPGLGPDQAPLQGDANTGGVEAAVRAFSSGTRALPLARDLVAVTVAEASGTFTITVENVSGAHGALMTPIAPVFWAAHDDSFSLFTAGSPDNGMGLETLAEDGSPADLVASHTGAAGILALGASTAVDERPGEDGASMPGEHFSFEVTPDADHPYLTIAAMVVESNDAFVAFPSTGMRLLDMTGAPRDAAELEAGIATMLGVWDAGTEANQVPGVGADQPIRGGGGTGADDPQDSVRHYDDVTNDLMGPGAGGFVHVTITHISGTDFEVVVENSSGSTAYPGVLTPVAWAVHDETSSLFVDQSAASAGLEVLAEAGDPSGLIGELDAMAGVGSTGVADTPEGTTSAGPIVGGQSYRFMVTADVDHRHLSLASMVVPSNDTFIAFPSAVALLDAAGAPRSSTDIMADVAGIVAWDAGTEANQTGAGGRDQAPRQASATEGAAEGEGTVRLYSAPWSLPSVGELIRVTIRPQG